MTYTVIIPIYNEERTLQLLLNQLKNLSSEIEIIIIDDGSNDNTQSILKNNQSLITLRNRINRGKGYCVKKGLQIAANQNIILIDGDLEIDISHIPKFIERFERSQKDVLVGKRWEKNNRAIFEINTIGNYLINMLFNIIYNTNVNDVLCCFKILNTKTLKSLNIKSNNFSIEIEIMAKLIIKKYSIDELLIDYKRRTRKEGKKLKISDGWDIILSMILLKLSKNI
jgi:glycosyltransferase involved in cell wall biosynthesis